MYKFGYQWEDYKVEEQCFNINYKNVLLITSGGETLFHLLSKFGNTINKIDSIDFNNSQNELVKLKFKNLENNNYYGGIFEELLYNAYNNNSFDELFSTDNLIKHFTDNAVKFTSKSFAEHFKNRINNMEKNHFYELLVNKINTNKYNIENINNNFNKVSFHTNNIIDFLIDTSNTYDFINLSNVTDWMNQKDIFSLLDLVYKKLKKNGVCIIRKLLSDNIITTDNFIIKDYTLLDKTNFYTQTKCLIKK